MNTDDAAETGRPQEADRDDQPGLPAKYSDNSASQYSQGTNPGQAAKYSDNSASQYSQSTNPLDRLSKASSPLPASRKITPIQAVFSDFATAHSSITSGQARSATNGSNFDLSSAKKSISSSELETRRRQLKAADNVAQSKDLPSPPAPAYLKTPISNGKPDIQDEDLPSESYDKVASPRFSCDAVRSVSTPLAAKDRRSKGVYDTPRSSNPRHSKWSMGSVYGDYSDSPVSKLYSGIVTPNFLSPGTASEEDVEEYSEAHAIEESFGSYEESMDGLYDYDAAVGYNGSHEDSDVILSPLAHGPDEPNPSSSTDWSPDTQGSTIIHSMEDYEHVNSDEVLYQDGNHSDESLPLPGLIPPSSSDEQRSPVAVPSTESSHSPARRYGTLAIDTAISGRPPSMSLPQLPADPGRAYLRSASPEPLARSSSYGDTQNLLNIMQDSPIDSRRSSQRGTPSRWSEYDEEYSYPPADAHLERDISRMLHIESDDDESERSVGQGRPAEGSVSDFDSVVESLRNDHQRFSEIFKDGFYSDLTSSPCVQAGSNRGVKVPINPSVGKAIARRISQRHASRTSQIVSQSDDVNDWETVGESLATSRPRTHMYSEMAFNETGSSIANISDHKDESSSGPILGPFSSSGRVFQQPVRGRSQVGSRPGQMMPLMPPKIRTKNGSSTNGSRFTEQEDSLSSSMKPQASSSPQKYDAPVQHAQQIPSPSPSRKRDATYFRQENFTGLWSLAKDWTDDSVDPDFARSPRAQYLADAHANARPDSYTRMVLANNGQVPQFVHGPDMHTVGSSVADASSISTEYNEDASPARNNAFRQTSHSPQFQVGQRDDGVQQLPQTPGFQDYETPNRAWRKRQSGIDGSQPRKRRPISSFMSDTLGPINPIIVQPAAPREFRYRSPLAPVKSKAWRHLYSATELDQINAVPLRPEQALARLNGATVDTIQSYEVHGSAPHLTPWKHESSSLRDTVAGRKTKISKVALGVLCCTFPPGLALMRAGSLDRFVVWYTGGEISHFGRRQKRIAGYAFAAYALAAVVAVVIALLFHFLH